MFGILITRGNDDSGSELLVMYEIDVIASQRPFLANDLFRHLHQRRKLKVFLGGKAPEGRHDDVRLQVRLLLAAQLGCDVFMGEDIDARDQLPRADRDHLTIEVEEAEQRDLIIMFLQSPGTISELTAFAMRPSTNPKLVVFNDVKYKGQKSFLNKGPLRLLKPDQIIYYDAAEDRPSPELVTQLDRRVARAWFDESSIQLTAGAADEFETFVAFATTYATFPVDWKDLVALFPFDERSLRTSLNFLFDRCLIRKEEKFYLPSNDLQDLPISSACAVDISRARAILMNARLASDDAISDYRLLLT